MSWKNRMLRCAVASAIASLTLAATAKADTVFFSYTDDNGLVADGSVDVTPTSTSGQYIATSGVLNITSGPLTLGSFPLVPNPSAPSPSYSPSNLFYFDSMLYEIPPGAPGTGGYLSNYGFLFDAGAGAEINLWGNPPGTAGTYSGWRSSGSGYNYSNDHGTFTVYGGETSPIVPTPQASIAGMSLLAGLGAVGMMKRRTLKDAVLT